MSGMWSVTIFGPMRILLNSASCAHLALYWAAEQQPNLGQKRASVSEAEVGVRLESPAVRGHDSCGHTHLPEPPSSSRWMILPGGYRVGYLVGESSGESPEQ